MGKPDESPLAVDEIAARLKCSRGWVQLSIDAGCPVDDEGRVSIRDFMLFQLTNIHRIRELAGLPSALSAGGSQHVGASVKAILTTQLEWLQARSTRHSVKAAAKLVCDRINEVSGI